MLAVHFYQQTFGTAMGSRVSVTVANLHADSSASGPSPILLRTPKLHGVHHPVYHRNEVDRHSAIPGHQDHPSQ